MWMLPWRLTRYNAVMVELIEVTGVGYYALAGANGDSCTGKGEKLTVAHDNRAPKSK